MAQMSTTLPDWVAGMLADDGWSSREVLTLLSEAPAKREPMEFYTNLLDFSYDPAADSFTVTVSYADADDPDATVTLSSADFLNELAKHTGGAP